MGRLRGKIAVVTGGASGIGQAFAKRLAEDGAAVAIADIGDTAETRALVEAAGVRFSAGRCDVTKPEEIETFARDVVERLGHPDILVNNVGIFPLQPFSDISFDDWRRIQAINVNSMFLFAKAFTPKMIERGYGRNRQSDFNRQLADDPQLRALHHDQGGGDRVYAGPRQRARTIRDNGQCDRPQPGEKRHDGRVRTRANV